MSQTNLIETNYLSGPDVYAPALQRTIPPESLVLGFTNASTAPAASFQPNSASSLNITPGPALAGTSQLSAPAIQGIPGSLGPGLLQWGPIQLHARLDYQVSYGNNLQSTPGQQVNTLVNQVSPGIYSQLGAHWALGYTPTFRFYSTSQFRDGVDHAAFLTGITTHEDWTFGLSQAFSLTSQPLIETGGQTDQEIYSTVLSASCQMSSKMSLDLGVYQNFRFASQPVNSEPLSDLREWSTMDWVNYQIAPHLGFGIGLGFGYDDVSIGPDNLFEQLQGRIVWQPGSKLSFAFAGGADYRQFLNSDTPNLLNPIYSVAVHYQLFEQTTLMLSGSGSVSPSYFQGATSENSSLSAGLRQRILGTSYLSVTGGYNKTSYVGTSTNLAGAPANDYNSTTLNFTLSTVILRRGSVSVFYALNFVSSGAAIYNYTTREVGLQLAYQF